MGSLSRALAAAFVVAALGITFSAPASARCLGLSGTADGFDKQTAVSRAQASIAESVAEIKSKYRVRNVSLSPMKAKPQPYWRDSVSSDLFVGSPIRTSSTYTICWTGV